MCCATKPSDACKEVAGVFALGHSPESENGRIWPFRGVVQIFREPESELEPRSPNARGGTDGRPTSRRDNHRSEHTDGDADNHGRHDAADNRSACSAEHSRCHVDDICAALDRHVGLLLHFTSGYVDSTHDGHRNLLDASTSGHVDGAYSRHVVHDDHSSRHDCRSIDDAGR